MKGYQVGLITSVGIAVLYFLALADAIITNDVVEIWLVAALAPFLIPLIILTFSDALEERERWI